MMFCQAVVAVTEISQVGEARREANRIAAIAGLDEADRGRAAIIASELATNLARYAQGGEVFLRTFVIGEDTGLEIVAVDRGPGMTNVDRCMEDGYSSGGTAGQGLGAVRRLASEFDIHSSQPGGTTILARVRKASHVRPSYPFLWGVMHRPCPQEVVSGDTWRLSHLDNKISLLIADGLGHGPQAAEAADAAADVFARDPFLDSADFLSSANQRLSGTRGAAIAVAQIDRRANSLRYAGVGNIAASLRPTPASKGKGLVSHNGTVGVAMRKAQNFDYECPGGSLLIMHSDGLQSRWSLESYPGLAERHPALIAAVLYRDFFRGRDDVTVCAVRTSAKIQG